MFKLQPPLVFRASVALTVPGQSEPGSIDIEWRHKGRKALKAWVDSAKKDAQDADLLAEVIADWHDVQDAEGGCVPYAQEALAVLIEAYPAAAGELFIGYLKAINGSRVKN